MSKNNKNARKASEAKQITAMHKQGNRGAKGSVKKTTKRKTWYNPESKTFWRKTDGGRKKPSGRDDL